MRTEDYQNIGNTPSISYVRPKTMTANSGSYHWRIDLNLRTEMFLFLVEKTQSIPYVSKCLFVCLDSEVTASARDVGKKKRRTLSLHNREKGSMICGSK